MKRKFHKTYKSNLRRVCETKCKKNTGVFNSKDCEITDDGVDSLSICSSSDEDPIYSVVSVANNKGMLSTFETISAP